MTYHQALSSLPQATLSLSSHICYKITSYNPFCLGTFVFTLPLALRILGLSLGSQLTWPHLKGTVPDQPMPNRHSPFPIPQFPIGSLFFTPFNLPVSSLLAYLLV